MHLVWWWRQEGCQQRLKTQSWQRTGIAATANHVAAGASKATRAARSCTQAVSAGMREQQWHCQARQQQP